jgi:hypothetical protein
MQNQSARTIKTTARPILAMPISNAAIRLLLRAEARMCLRNQLDELELATSDYDAWEGASKQNS